MQIIYDNNVNKNEVISSYEKLNLYQKAFPQFLFDFKTLLAIPLDISFIYKKEIFFYLFNRILISFHKDEDFNIMPISNIDYKPFFPVLKFNKSDNIIEFYKMLKLADEIYGQTSFSKQHECFAFFLNTNQELFFIGDFDTQYYYFVYESNNKLALEIKEYLQNNELIANADFFWSAQTYINDEENKEMKQNLKNYIVF